MIYKKIALLLMPLIFLSGCSDKKNEAEKTFKTVEYYIKNPDIRKKRRSECKTLSEMTETIAIDCENAYIATSKKTIEF